METEKVEAVYLLNAPSDYTMSEKAEKQYGLIQMPVDNLYLSGAIYVKERWII